MATGRSASRNVLGAAMYVAGAAAYWYAVERLGVTFDATPLIFGLVALVGSAVRPRLLASAVLLLVWGGVVLLVRHGPLPDDREAPLFLLAFGVGAALLVALRRWIPPKVALESVAAVLVGGGAGFYLAGEDTVFTSAWFWSAVLLASGALLVVPLRRA